MKMSVRLKKIVPVWLKDILKMMYAYAVPIEKIKSSKKAIKAYKGIYAGKRCFVIGNGPSLTSQDLDKLSGEFTFAANRIYHMFDKTVWRPTFYCVQDVQIAEAMGDSFLKGSSEAEATFIRMKAYDNVKNIFNRIKNVVLVPIFVTDSEKNMRFSERADKHIHDGWNVTYMSIQLAVYMGFSEIYLLGVDFSYPIQLDMSGAVAHVDKSIAAHFYESADDNKTEAEIWHRTHRDRVLAYYEVAERYSRNSGKFRIYNATRGGKLEAFERVDFDSLF